MHPFASGSSLVTLSKHGGGGMGSGGVTVSPGSNTTTLAFTDADGNVITSNVDTSPGGHPGGGVTIVTADSLVGSHFLSDTPVTKLEIEDDVTAHLPNPTFGTATNKQQRKSGNVPEGEKKVCLWPTGNGTTCGKTFTKFDSLKRHLAEAHKGVRPFACSLCDKSYGRRDYLQRHLKSHNANYAVNLASASNINASQVVQTVNKVQVKPQNTIILQQGPSGQLQVVQTPPNLQTTTTNASSSSTGPSALPFLSLTNSLPQPHKPLGSKICRWVQNDGTVCGKAFSKLDSLRRHVNELHKGVRPFACSICDKNYGRRDYLDRHLKSHDPENQKKKMSSGTLDWTGAGVLLAGDEPPKKVVKKKRKDIPAEEKKICLWVLEDGTACGKTFTKFDSLKRHVSEAHKGIRPYSCTLCGKTYGRRDYLLRHLKSHNESEVANISTTRIVSSNNQVVGHVVGTSGAASNISPTGLLGAGGLASTSGMSSSPIRFHATGKKRLSEKKTCRWVLDNGTICGRTFTKFDSLRRHVQELHKGVRPFQCQFCDKSYGRRDYLERHMRSHNPNAGADGAAGHGNDDNNVTPISGNREATLNEAVTVVTAEDDISVENL